MNQFRLFVAIAFLLSCGVARGAEVLVGQEAPDFAVKDQNGKIRQLADFKGKTLILAFYPKDFTGG